MFIYKLHAFLIKSFRTLLILPTGRTFATNFPSWSHEHIIWALFWYNIRLINELHADELVS